jgi:NIMA (never in mitosis gene a)-related kinase 2
MDQYEELETIGTGAFGKVCKVKRKADDKILVWKELNYGTMNEQEKQQLVAEVSLNPSLYSFF